MKGRWHERIDTAQLETILDEHFHTISRWFGAKDGANETNAMDDVLTAFQIDSGNDTWGTALCIIGSGDTPVDTGMTYFHLNRVLFVDNERSSPYKLRIAWGDSYAAGIAAGQYSEHMALPGNDNNDFMIRLPRIATGTKVFIACWVGNNTGTLDFFIGIHEYQI